MTLDLILALIALGGSAILGFMIAKQFLSKSFEANRTQQQLALTEAQQALAEANMQLDHCTKRRRELSRKMADLTAKLENQEVQAKPKPSVITQKKQVSDRQKHSNNRQKEVLERIKAKSEQINFERIGRASGQEKDDLKVIKGVGPFIEEKLNALGIYTFAQIANFNQEDEMKVNEAIEFFSGRIKRDGWVNQAKALKAGKSKV